MPARTKVFISYSHQDVAWLNRLRVHLRPLERDQDIDIWDDTKIPPGSRWRHDIASTIAATKVAILLISADFLASDFIATDELPPLLAAAEAEGATILPIIVSPSRFMAVKTLSAFQSVNPPSRPLIDMTRGEQEAVFVRVAEVIESLLRVAGGDEAAAAAPAAGAGDDASPVPATGVQREAVRRTLEEMHALFEEVHQAYLESFRRYRDLIQATTGDITANHPVVDAIRSDHVFSGGPRAKLLAMVEIDGGGALAPFAAAVERYLTGIRRKETYFQIPNAPRMDFQRQLEATFAATPAQHTRQLGLLRRNAREQAHLRHTDPNHPMLALLDGNATAVTARQSKGIKVHEILKVLDTIVEKTQAQYAKVSREYLAARKSLLSN